MVNCIRFREQAVPGESLRSIGEERTTARDMFRLALGHGGVDSSTRLTPSRWRGPTPTARCKACCAGTVDLQRAKLRVIMDSWLAIDRADVLDTTPLQTVAAECTGRTGLDRRRGVL